MLITMLLKMMIGGWMVEVATLSKLPSCPLFRDSKQASKQLNTRHIGIKPYHQPNVEQKGRGEKFHKTP